MGNTFKSFAYDLYNKHIYVTTQNDEVFDIFELKDFAVALICQKTRELSYSEDIADFFGNNSKFRIYKDNAELMNIFERTYMGLRDDDWGQIDEVFNDFEKTGLSYANGNFISEKLVDKCEFENFISGKVNIKFNDTDRVATISIGEKSFTMTYNWLCEMGRYAEACERTLDYLNTKISNGKLDKDALFNKRYFFYVVTAYKTLLEENEESGHKDKMLTLARDNADVQNCLLKLTYIKDKGKE